MWPALRALRELGGSATDSEMYERLIGDLGLTEEQQAVMTKDGRRPMVEMQLHWARAYLMGIGAVTNSTRGVWSITEKGDTITIEQMREETKRWRSTISRRGAAQRSVVEDPDEATDVDGQQWKDLLKFRLMQIPPAGFERLIQRLLREAGFVNVDVLGRTGDGGIDGMGVYRLSLVSFPVFFQCKRYSGSVGSSHVRDFRGAMSGRGEKGLLITTGSFTRDATAEAGRDGAPPVELIDGDRLCELLRDYRLGVDVTQRVEEVVEIVDSFFDEYGSAGQMA